jgi:tetratricopeptide (TPR) repeat protein
VWWKLLREQNDKETVAKTLSRLHTLRSKRLNGAELEALIRFAIPRLKKTEKEEELDTLASTCMNLQRDDLARGCLEKLANEKNQWMPLAQFLLKKEHWEQAATALEKASSVEKENASAYFLRGWALVKAGKEQEGRRWMELAHWLPLGREEMRYTLAGALTEHGLYDEAAREWDFTCRLGDDDEFYVGIALRRTANRLAREGKYEQAAAYCIRADIHLLWSGSYVNNRSWISQPHWVMTLRAQGEIRAGKFDEAQRTIQNAVELMPGNIELALACVPALERKGRKTDADALFDQFFNRYRKLCKEYPRSADFHNQLAWLAVMCQRQLDVALDHAKEAVRLAPKNTSYLDTLAEVYFQRGEQKLAVDAISRAAALDPASSYLRQQQRRITAGDRAVPVPEN